MSSAAAIPAAQKCNDSDRTRLTLANPHDMAPI
jgi:hypothetical protein